MPETFEMQPMACPDDLECVKDQRGVIWRRVPSTIPGSIRDMWVNSDIDGGEYGNFLRWSRLLALRGPVTRQETPDVVIPAARFNRNLAIAYVLKRQREHARLSPQEIVDLTLSYLKGAPE